MKFKLLILVAVMVGCERLPNERNCEPRIELGKVVSAARAQTTWNEAMKMQVVTEKAVVIIYGLPTVIIGEPAALLRCDDATWLLLSGHAYITGDQGGVHRKVKK